MKTHFIFLLIFLPFFTSNQNPQPQTPILQVGQIVPGKIDPSLSNSQMHPITIDRVEMKYLFIRLSTFQTNLASIGLYSNSTGQLLFSCMDNTYDTCYIPSKVLKNKTSYVILVMSDIPLTYNLYSYWGDLEHLKPDQQVKFRFDNKDKTQLFHLQLENQKEYSQIRIVLRPETMRTEGDSLKIFANRGFQQQPTQQTYHYQSMHVWNDAEAIFLNKEDLKGQKGIAIYIVGNAKTVYVLNCELVRKDYHSLQLNQTVNEHIQGNKEAMYHMQFKNTSNVDIHVVRFSVFTGEVQVGFYYDKQMTKPFNKLPFQYMSDIQFHIEKQDLQQGTKQMYMKVRARQTACTFQVNIQGRQKVQGFEMYENVFEFVPIKVKQSMYFYSHIWNQNQYDSQKSHIFDISLIKAKGQSKINFYLCKPNANEDICKKTGSSEFVENSFPLKPMGLSQVGSKTIYSIQVDQNQYTDINSVEKRALIIAELSTLGEPISYAAVEFSNSNKVRLLRQGRAFEDKVRLSQEKYYKYQNDNPSISVIKIHINEISGLTKIFAKRTDTRLQTGAEIHINPHEPNTILITENLTDPVFIQITGLVTSIYTISVSTVNKDHPLSNSQIMSEDIQYEFKLLPYQHKIIEIHPIQDQVTFDFSCDGGSILACEIGLNGQCKGDSFYSNRGQLKIDSRNVREVRIKIGNNVYGKTLGKGKQKKNSIKSIKVTTKYHANNKQHCEQRKINKVYSEVVKTNSCYKFHLPLAADIQILSSRQNLGQSLGMFFICTKKVNAEFINNRYIIRGTVIRQSCKDLPNDMSLLFLLSELNPSTDKKSNDIRMDYSVEYKNDIITLADGVAYTTNTKNRQQSIKTFFYEIIDEQSNIQIVLFNKKGNQYFYASVVQKSNRYFHVVNEAQATITSKTDNYDQNPTASVTENQISKANCGRDCLLVISIFSKEKVGSSVEFGIEVIENQILLKQDQIQTYFLSKGSVRYFQYTTRNNPTDLLFKVSDNNRNCLRSFLSTFPFPSSQNSQMTENEGSMMFKNATKGTYYYALQALQDCPFSISVSEGDNKLTRIEHGQYYDIKLKEGDDKWFYFKHLSKTSFKIVSLLRYGGLQISVNQKDLSKDIIELITNKKLRSNKFAFKNNYQNSLSVRSNNKNFCFDCTYLLHIKALKHTEGSVFLGSESSKITLSEGKTFFDELIKQNETTLATFYKVSSGKFNLNVHSGKIKIEMNYQDQSFSQTYETNKTAFIQDYKFTKAYLKTNPIQIRIIAEQIPAVYSLEMLPTLGEEIKINPGVSSTASLVKGQQLCFNGILRAKNEEIDISTDADEKADLSTLQITSTLNGNVAEIVTQVTGNILSIRFQIQETFFPEAKQYRVCLASKNKDYSFQFNIIQNQNINFIPADTYMMIKESNTFVIHHNGFVILDLFECKDRLELVYSSDLEELNVKQPGQLQMMGIAGKTHAIRVESEQILYFKAKATSATILWMPLVQSEQRGIGYYKYSIGSFSYSTGFNVINFAIGGVFKSKQTNTSVVSIRYLLYISNSTQLLQQAIMCSKNVSQKVLTVQIYSTNIGTDKPIVFQTAIEKKKISDLFTQREQLFFNVVAFLTLLPPNQQKQHEHYKFIYSQQSVPSEAFLQNYAENMNSKLLIVLVIVIIVGILMISFVFVRWVAPVIGRLKNNLFIEESHDDNRQQNDDFEAPPSSDRNQIGGTDDRIE